jgi:hypothetical protein
MIVKDLISQLKKLPQDATVVLFDENSKVQFITGTNDFEKQNQVEIVYSWTMERFEKYVQ